MTFAAWLTLLSAWIVAVASPGPDFLAVLRTSASSGRRAGLAVAAGVASGIGLWVTLALTGLAVLFARYEAAYVTVRYLGAAFLVGYGALIVWKTRRASTSGATEAPDTPEAQGATRAGVTPAIGMAKAYRLGLLTNLANPKALVFFGALLASLIPQNASSLTHVEAFTGIVAVAFAWFTAVAWIASAPRIAGGYRRASRRIDRVVGTLFAGVGISLAASA